LARVWKHHIPVIITEARKRRCLLTLGYAASCPAGYLQRYRRETQTLIAELELFAQRDRLVYICFDYETKANVLKNVSLAIAKLGRLLTRLGCDTKLFVYQAHRKA
jgi:hypothetical protein